MERQLEPELMEDPDQVEAYARADFSVPHNDFIERIRSFVGRPDFNGSALDLGCGPGDVTFRFARAFPSCRIDAVDGSRPMIERARASAGGLAQRIRFIHGRLPFVTLPQQNYEIIFSNSLLHHLPDPQILWRSIKTHSRPGTQVAVMDLLRPDSIETARSLVKTYAGEELDILQRDFYHSLLAAFSLEEIKAQLIRADLKLNPEQISDRHVFIKGIL
ncbi:class I SAM-dependent methyltransferase [Methylosarcina fibrata]|uniref:class I SAM-dependent methyltransferase n=1 Tax=Methylosarcina fibrata TaxID=105972 RepID=UPI00036124B6|nr:class I SAM-dependent methyltransferase [Methylosarcina fibrata]